MSLTHSELVGTDDTPVKVLDRRLPISTVSQPRALKNDVNWGAKHETLLQTYFRLATPGSSAQLRIPRGISDRGGWLQNCRCRLP
jgi:hypothetical protein